MKVCVFLGPSLPIVRARDLMPDGIFLPPVQQGDLFTAVQTHAPSTICIIDGYFQQRPSVWHKEILWAMSQGVHVYGAASMGALRAAELEPFGMVGIGAIFEAFRSGALPPFKGLVDDDEVAVVHGPAETGYLMVTEALVNIRHTLSAALAQHVIDEPTHDALIEQARLTHFTERSHASLVDKGRAIGLCSKAMDHLETWLPNGKIDQKLNDAVLLLQHVALKMQQAYKPLQVQFIFEETEIWRDAVADICAQDRLLEKPDTLQLAIIDELRLDRSAYLKVKQSALLDCLFESDKHSEASLSNVTEQSAQERSIREIANQYRLVNGLLDRESVDHWLKINDMEAIEFDDLMNHENRFRSALNTPDTSAIIEAIIARLRLTGDYPAYASRARQKLAALEGTP